MKDLIRFIIENITGSDDFLVEEDVDANRINIFIQASPDIVGLIIGKEGRTIKAIRKVASIKATLENKSLRIDITEKETKTAKKKD